MKNPKIRFVKPLLWLAELAIIVSLIGSIISLVKKQDVVAERAKVLSRVQSENEKLKQELVEAQSPGFVERQARNKLGLVKPGETVVLVERGTPSASAVQARQPVLSRWQEWWQLFF